MINEIQTIVGNYLDNAKPTILQTGKVVADGIKVSEILTVPYELIRGNLKEQISLDDDVRLIRNHGGQEFYIVEIIGKSQGGPTSAKDVVYDNTDSELESNRVQGAIDEVNSQLASKVNKTDIVNNDTTGGVDKVASAEVVKVHGQEIDAINDNLGYIKEIYFNPSSGTIDLNTLKQRCTYKFAGAVSVVNWIASTLVDATLLSVGGDNRGWQIVVLTSELYFRRGRWDGEWFPWCKITGTVIS